MPTEKIFDLDTLKKMYENVFDTTFVLPYSEERHVWEIPVLLMNHMDWDTIYERDVERAMVSFETTGKAYERAIRELIYQENGFDVLSRLVDKESLINELVNRIKETRDAGPRFEGITDFDIEKEVREIFPDMVELINATGVLKNIDHKNKVAAENLNKEETMSNLEEKGFSLEALQGAYGQLFESEFGGRYANVLMAAMPWETVFEEESSGFLEEMEAEPRFTFDDYAGLMVQAGAQQLLDQYINSEKQQELAINEMKEYVAFDSRYGDVTEDALKDYFADNFHNPEEAFKDPFTVLDAIQEELLSKEEAEQNDLINPAARDQPLASGKTDTHLFDTYQDAYINTGQSDLFQSPEALFDRNGNLYNDEIDVDDLVDAMQTYAETELNDLQKTRVKKGLNQKQTKALKKDIVEEGALQIGYLHGVKAKMLELDPDIIEKTIASAGGWVGESLTLEADTVPQRGEFDNILVTEMVRNLNYQDFKEVAPYFFQYSSMVAENGQTEIIGQDVNMPESTLQKHIEDGALDNGVRFELPKSSLNDVQDGYDIVAYNPIEKRSITIDMGKDGQSFELSLANQIGEKMGQPIYVSEEDFNNSVVASDKVHELFVLNGIEKQTAIRFASMEVIDRLQESGLSFSKSDLDAALKEPKQMQSVEKIGRAHV